jgi:2-oxoglutarate/2-oxoacid ferredoxin oxidoreductase subunit alpha
VAVETATTTLLCMHPESIQEAMDMMTKGFDVADEYRNPVMILADGMLGQMMEPVTIPPEAKEPIMGDDIAKAKPWALTGHKNKRDRNAINSVWLDQHAFAKYSDKLWQKYIKAEKELPEYETVSTWKMPTWCLPPMAPPPASFGNPWINWRNKGIKAGLIRPKTVWPFPYQCL